LPRPTYLSVGGYFDKVAGRRAGSILECPRLSRIVQRKTVLPFLFFIPVSITAEAETYQDADDCTDPEGSGVGQEPNFLVSVAGVRKEICESALKRGSI